jgi:hypothetical protein
MKTQIIATAALTCLLSTSSYAQTAVGTGIGTSEATAVSGAVAIAGSGGRATATGGQGGNSTATGGTATGGQGGQGGQGGRGGRAVSTGSNSNSALTINTPANTRNEQVVSGTTTSNVNQNVSGSTTSNINQRVSGSTTVRSAPSMVAPGLAAAGLETCLGSASGTVSAIGFGIGGGSTYADEGCQARLDSRTLYAYGLKAAAVARLCQRVDIWRSMPDMCAQYWPVGQPYPAGVYVAPAGVAITMSASGGSGETLRIVNGKTGVEGDCINYSHTKQKCYQWAGEAPHKSRVAALPPPQRIVIKPKPKAPPEPPKVEPVKVTEPQL